MLVPVTVVGGMAMPVVQVVEMIAVRDRLVTAVRAVLVRVGDVHHVEDLGVALVPVAFVVVVGVAVVEVIDVIAVAHGDVAALGTVHVVVLGWASWSDIRGPPRFRNVVS